MKLKLMIGLALAAGIAVADDGFRKLYLTDYVDRMEGAWLGQSVGVAMGTSTEFEWKGEIIPETCEGAQWKCFPSFWDPDWINRTFEQDDIYVEMTFLQSLCRYGLDVTPAQAGVDFAKTRYRLWCANLTGRNNVRKYICPPDSSHPSVNSCANDIDYQIEADYAGIISPGLPRRVNKLAQVFGRIMNYGDGLWAGEFMGAMYAEAFFETNNVKVVEAGLKAIPAESQYAEVVRDMLVWYKEEQVEKRGGGGDWKGAWQKFFDKWVKAKGEFKGDDNPSPLKFTNGAIDARVNGAMVVLGLLWGNGDLLRTMEISTRGGYDSDCNPSSAAGVLGTMLGKRGIPKKYYEKLDKGRTWEFTDYTYDKLICDCQQLARKIVLAEGGRIEKDEKGEYFLIPNQTAVPDKYEPAWAPGPKANAAFTDVQRQEIEAAYHRYLIVGHGDLVKKGKGSDIARELLKRLSNNNGTLYAVDALEVTDAAALKACVGKIYEGVVLIPGYDTDKPNDDTVVSSNQVAAMSALLDSVKTKAAVVVELDNRDFENFRRLQDVFRGRAAVIMTRDAESRMANIWGNYAPEGMRRIELALKYAADPAKRDWMHPLPGKVTMEGTWMVLDFETPALRGQSLIVGDTLFRKFYVRSAGKANWTRTDNAYVEGNKLYLDCSKIKDPAGVRLNWWGISPFQNVDYLPTPSFVISLDAK